VFVSNGTTIYDSIKHPENRGNTGNYARTNQTTRIIDNNNDETRTAYTTFYSTASIQRDTHTGGGSGFRTILQTVGNGGGGGGGGGGEQNNNNKNTVQVLQRRSHTRTYPTPETSRTRRRR